MNRLRNQLIVAFLTATLIPLVTTLWITTSLLERSLGFATTEELDRLSTTLEETARELYQRDREALRQNALAGGSTPVRYAGNNQAGWPEVVTSFWESGEEERFVLSGTGGNRLEYMVRRPMEVWVYARDLGNVRMEQLTDQYRQARELVETARTRDLRRGFVSTLLILVAAVWLVSLVWLIYLADRISHPIQELTGGLARLADGDLQVRLRPGRNDETGRAILAFNHMAEQLERNRERLVYLTQVASWQMLARKMAHELKNSLTPIRLTVEEIAARKEDVDRGFMEQAMQIVVTEIETLERRVRAFSEFSSEPTARPSSLDVNALIEERVSLLRPAHVDLAYTLRLSGARPAAFADADHVKGILTNLLENAADAAGPGGEILGITDISDGRVVIEVHDSGPGVNYEARRSLFEPTITFKKHGMGLGLSIARKSALLAGGDIMLVKGKLGGAGFRVILPSCSLESRAASPESALRPATRDPGPVARDF